MATCHVGVKVRCSESQHKYPSIQFREDLVGSRRLVISRIRAGAQNAFNQFLSNIAQAADPQARSPPTTPKATVQVRDVSYHPPGCDAPLLQHVNMEIKDRTIGLIYGRSGSGKTTLMQLLAGLREPTDGAVCMVKNDGTVTTLDKEARQSGCGLVFQFPERHFIGNNLITELLVTAPDGTSPGGYSQRLELQQRLPAVLMATGLQHLSLQTDPSTLSDGYKRRLALAVQLLRRPTLLLLDEPLAGLDWQARKYLVAMLLQLKKECSLLMISHDLRELSPIVDTAWEMQPGGCLVHRGKNIPVPAIAV